ncbi:MAG: uroporphyrinogen-III C-methyltransferase [Cyclobacteriaceae bacterium]|nr:uroporphyrinogen-III C-methyltransferase [Cyclobacteriaceae bacterium]
MSNQSKLGTVILAGAGPGDPELITLKAWHYLQRAEVVIADRLVSPELLIDLKPEVQVIFIGKQGGNPNSTSQETINQLLVKYASEHSLIVRLKGGDVAFFSNVLEELETLIAHQIPYEIIPGITSASGASAYAGIPLTARNFATSVRFLTYTNPEDVDPNLIKEWAETNDTLVFYMSSRLLTSLLTRLIENKIADDKWVAVIEQATTPGQQVNSFPVHGFLSRLEKIKFISPTLIIVGRVAQLHDKYNWVKSTNDTPYFKSIRSPYVPELIIH